MNKDQLTPQGNKLRNHVTLPNHIDRTEKITKMENEKGEAKKKKKICSKSESQLQRKFKEGE
jgi:hypothetical protein